MEEGCYSGYIIQSIEGRCCFMGNCCERMIVENINLISGNSSINVDVEQMQGLTEQMRVWYGEKVGEFERITFVDASLVGTNIYSVVIEEIKYKFKVLFPDVCKIEVSVEEPPTTSCTDSDGGKGYYVKGSMDYGGITYTDYCQLKIPYTPRDEGYKVSSCNVEEGCYLIENYCESEQMGNWEGYKCSDGCQDGACVSTSLMVGEPCIVDLTNCSEADKYIAWKNYTQLNGAIDLALYTDKYGFVCAVNTGEIVQSWPVENEPGWWCGDVIVPSQLPCTDSDGGKNYYVKGNTAGYDSTFGFHQGEDRCIQSPITNKTELEEYYCNLPDIDVWAEHYDCPNGCNDGTCNQLDCSVDATGCKGLNYSQSYCGKVSYDEVWTGYESELQKICTIEERDGVNSTWSFEQSCAVITECPNGCSDGACISNETTST